VKGADVRIGDWSDRRAKWQLELGRVIEQDRADQAIEKRWRENVKENELRRLAAKVENE
jgi:hypothetical protein